jgi:rare lipoprotein A
MRLKIRFWASPALALCVALITAHGAEARTKHVPTPTPPASTPVVDVDSETSPPPVRRDDVNYDEVGYAFVPRDSGSESVSVTHATLPIDSFAEVTNLQNGRTILVRVSEHDPLDHADLLSLSPGAARQLGVENAGRVPVRIRRVNPPEYERRLLAGGGRATERLPTPPGLLNALKLKLKDQPVGKVAPAPSAPPMKAEKPMKMAKAMPEKGLAKPAVKPMPVPQKTAVSGSSDGFIVEEQATAAKPKAVPKPKTEPMAKAPPKPSATGSYFVQIGAFGSEAAARSVANRAGASAVNGGSLWRVRAGPYQNAAEAQRALGGLRAKGYRDARVTR